MSTEITVMIRNCETDILTGQDARVQSFLYDGEDLFEFARRVGSANFDSGAVNSVEVTSKAVRS